MYTEPAKDERGNDTINIIGIKPEHYDLIKSALLSFDSKMAIEKMRVKQHFAVTGNIESAIDITNINITRDYLNQLFKIIR